MDYLGRWQRQRPNSEGGQNEAENALS